MVPELVPVPVLLLPPRQAAKALSMSERKLWELTKRGEIIAVRIGRSVRYDVRDLQVFINRAKQPRLAVTE